jgi:hypothetical protein
VPAPLLTQPESGFCTHGFVLQPVEERAAELASEIEAAKPKDAKYTIPIAGHVAQLDMLASQQPGGLTAQQLARIIALAVDTAHRHTHIPSAQLQVRSIKLLTARAGDGEQLIHFDHHDGFITSGRFSFLLYITEGSQSTAMWRHPLALLPQDDSSAAMKAAYARLFDKQQYHTVRVHQGQSMFFDERAPHFGSRTQRMRRVLFVQLAGQLHSAIPALQHRPPVPFSLIVHSIVCSDMARALAPSRCGRERGRRGRREFSHSYR